MSRGFPFRPAEIQLRLMSRQWQHNDNDDDDDDGHHPKGAT